LRRGAPQKSKWAGDQEAVTVSLATSHSILNRIGGDKYILGHSKTKSAIRQLFFYLLNHLDALVFLPAENACKQENRVSWTP